MRITLRKWLAIDNTNVDKSAKGANCQIKLILLVKCYQNSAPQNFFLFKKLK